MKHLISIDPGWSTGLVIGTYSESEPFKVERAYQIEGGVEEFAPRVRHEYCTDDFSDSYGSTFFTVTGPEGFLSEYFLAYGGLDDEASEDDVTFLVEKFNARGSANKRFSYTTKSLEPLRVEGALIARDVPITWVQPQQQYGFGGKDKAEKKKRQHAWLKENGYYVAPKAVGSKDADDVRSALAHAILWLRRQKHQPTRDLFRRAPVD